MAKNPRRGEGPLRAVVPLVMMIMAILRYVKFVPVVTESHPTRQNFYVRGTSPV